jgi:hypothetical protein
MMRSLIPFIAAIVAAITMGIINPSVPTANHAVLAKIKK